MRFSEFMESATSGATTSGNMATVVNPAVARSKAKPRIQKPTDNALDSDVSLFGTGKMVKRNSKKPLGSL